jgi:hypothetical protein
LCSSGSFSSVAPFSQGSDKKKKMRACFLGQNVCALGFGVATLQTPPMLEEPAKPYLPPAIIPDVTSIHPGDEISTGFGAAAPLRTLAASPVRPAPLA